MPFGVRQSHQRDFVTETCEREGDVRGLFDPVVEGGEEEDVFYCVLRIAYWVLQDRFDCFNGLRERFFQTRKIEVIFAGAVFLPKRVIEFGGERQFAKKIAESVFCEHNILVVE